MSENTDIPHGCGMSSLVIPAFTCVLLTDVAINHADLTVSALSILTGIISHVLYWHIPVVNI